MARKRPGLSWRDRIWRWLRSWLRPGQAPPEGAGAARAEGGRAYPDYVTCPHCGEPEVEVWSDKKNARCHNCGQTFDYVPRPSAAPDPPAT